MMADFFYYFSSIENNNGNLYIKPENEEFETFVNGELLTHKKQIFNGDRVVIGGSHYFRISNPNCSHRLQETVSFVYTILVK